MTTYYLKSQFIEKLATDSNLAEQIELLPQTSKTYSGENYLRASAAAAGGSDIQYYGPTGERFDYLSVKNTGTNMVRLYSAEKIADLSLTVSGSTQSDTTDAASGSIAVGKTTFTSTNDATIKMLEGVLKFKNLLLIKDSSNKTILNIDADAGGDSIVVLASGTYSSSFTAEVVALNIHEIGAGETVTVKADGQFYSGDSGTIPMAFLLESGTTDGTTFPSFQATVTGISA